MKPGDLVRYREQYINDETYIRISGVIGLIISEDSRDAWPIFSVMFNGEVWRSFEWELESVSGDQ